MFIQNSSQISFDWCRLIWQPWPWPQMSWNTTLGEFFVAKWQIFEGGCKTNKFVVSQKIALLLLLFGLSIDFAYLSLLRIQTGSCYIRPTLYLSVLTAFVFFGSDWSLVMGMTVELSRSFIVGEPHYVPALVMWTSWTILLSCIATRIVL